jgi:hypothetical protein
MKKININKLQTEQVFFILAGLIFFIGSIIFVWLLVDMFRDGDNTSVFVEEKQEGIIEEEVCEYMHILDGVCVDNADDIVSDLVGVMIENNYEARPLSGIGMANIIYEAPVEGNITRFFAIFNRENSIDKVGPVRSARPYYLDWLSEYGDMMYMHVGGSPEALENIQTYGVFDMNEFARGWYYWRSSDRRAPHNTYTSSNLWNKAYEAYAKPENNNEFLSWKFTEKIEDDCGETCVDSVNISYSPPTYASEWQYVSSTKQFERYEGGRIHKDREENAIVADTIIVQKMDVTVIDNVGRLRIDTIGSGQVLVFRNGRVIEGEWRKDDRVSRTRFYDVEGVEISLKPGKIWVSIVGDRHRVEF